MSKWKLKSLDRDFASGLLRNKPHHLQSSLQWFDFIVDFSGEDDRSVTLFRDGEAVAFFCALQFRNLIQSLPYPASYSGLQFSQALSAADMRHASELLCDHYARYCDVLTICSSPCFADHQDDTSAFDYTFGSAVHALNLQGDPLSRTTSKFRNNLQRNLRKAETAGVKIRVETGTESLGNWYRCYEKRIVELKGAQLPYEYFEQMFKHLQTAGHCSLFSAKARGKFLGGIVTVQNNHCLDYYLSMFDREEDDTQASTAAFHFVMNHAKQRGIELMNLQSSPRSQTDLIRFKESWGAIPVRHQYLVKILNNKSAILGQTSTEINEKYPFHFLVPFEALNSEPALA